MRFAGAAAFVLLTSHAVGYEQTTHAAITAAAVSASVLGDSSRTVVRSLGLDGFAPMGDGTRYFEFISSLAGESAYDRTAQRYEIEILNLLIREEPIDSPRRWLMYGAIREDDNPNEDPPTPQDVEIGLRRPLHHFFDPAFNRPLTVDGLSALESDVRKNVDWALGVRDAFSDPNAEESPRRNRFTIFDAREAMFRALTLKAKANGMLTDLSVGTDSTTRQKSRQQYWTTAFRALGNVLHLNQDMAQPQHTRNEVHSGIACLQTVHACPTGHTSVYEKYIDARARKSRAFNTRAPFNAQVRITPTDLPLGSTYSVPRFSRYSDYWSTAPHDPDVGGKGLADYSNRGFFTAAKNLGRSEYPWPSNDPLDYVIRDTNPTYWDGSFVGGNTPVQVFYDKVRDKFLDTSTSDVPLTTFGLWDQFLKQKSASPRYTLNRLNYDAMANLLLPRAVAYSAGLINFFFRGTFDITLPDEGVFAVADHGIDKGFTKLRAKVRNTTLSFVDAQNNPQPQNMTGGTLFAVIKYHTDKQYVASLDKVVGAAPCDDYTSVINPDKLDASTTCRDGIEQIVVSKPLNGMSLDAGAETLVEFDFADSPIPLGMTDAVLQIIYRGVLGSERDAVAVGTLDISEPTYFTYQNASDYIHIGQHVYTRSDVDANPDLLAQVQPRECVDYRQSPPHLAADCFGQFYLDLIVGFSDLANPLAAVELLPPRHFMRIVYLTVANEAGDVSAKSARRNVTVSARRHAGPEKALLLQEGACLPVDPFDIQPRHAQMTVLTPSQIQYSLDPITKLRGVNGWYNASCVINGDATIPGTVNDDRVKIMTPLDPDSDEVRPYPVTVMPNYL